MYAEGLVQRLGRQGKQAIRCVFSPFAGEPLYQSREHACSGNDAELIAFNPDTADNTEEASRRQREQ